MASIIDNHANFNGGDPVRRVLDRLPDAKKTGDKYQARCPAHDDKNPSLTISRGDDGRALIHCFAGCTVDDVCHGLGITKADLFLPNHNGSNGKHKPSLGPPTAIYDYHAADGSLVFQVLRHPTKKDGKKVFSQRRPDGKGGWVWNMDRVDRVLYKLPALLAADPEELVFIVEGEKDADTLHSVGLTATCNPGGATNWHVVADDSALYGKRVAIIADKDKAGRKHVKEVAERLYGKAQEIKVLELPGDGVKDATDWFNAGGTAAELLRLIEATAVYEKPIQETPTPTETPTFELTDLGNAERLVYRHGATLRHCAAIGWLVWDGTRWKRDETGEVERLAKKTVRRIAREAETALGTEPKLADALWKHARASEARNKINAMIDLAESEADVAIGIDSLDSNDWLFNCTNGTINLRTGQLQPHNPNDLITIRSEVAYDPQAECPLWLEHLGTIFDGNTTLIRYVQQCLGMALTGDVSEQAFWIWHGDGQNGKSTTLDLICSIFGPYAGDAPPSLLVQKRNDEHPTEIADLAGKRLIIGSETEENAKLKIQLIKRLTGDATLKGRFCKKDYFSFRRTFKLVLVTNNKPTVTEDTKAVWRRIKLVPFTVVIPDDKRDAKLLEKLKAEAPGILAWLVQGCIDWKTNGLIEPEAVKSATESYRAESDPIREFIADRCTTGPSFSVESQRLYEAYVAFAQERGEKAVTATAFGKRLGRLGYKSDKVNRKRGRLGIGLNCDGCDTWDRFAGYSHEEPVIPNYPENVSHVSQRVTNPDIDTENAVFPTPPEPMPTTPPAKIPKDWTAASFKDYLNKRAANCDDPDRAAELQAQADSIKVQ